MNGVEDKVTRKAIRTIDSNEHLAQEQGSTLRGLIAQSVLKGRQDLRARGKRHLKTSFDQKRYC